MKKIELRSRLLLLFHFENTFDTVEWSIIQESSQYNGFDHSLISRIRAGYCDAPSAVLINGYISEFFFSEKRGSLKESPVSLSNF